jgi:hypothetical protein
MPLPWRFFVKTAEFGSGGRVYFGTQVALARFD